MRAFDIAVGSIRNIIIRNELKLLGEKTIQGLPLANSMSFSRYIPELFIRMIAIGEENSKIARNVSNGGKLL